MIERNLGNLERIVRLSVGVFIATWAMIQPALSATEIFVVVVGLMLILNGIFSRCYLWYILNLSTAEQSDMDCA